MKNSRESAPERGRGRLEQETPARVPNHHAFTLIELLVVMAIIAILAALLLPAMAGVNRMKAVSRARGELAQINSCIAAYKEKLGHFPPDNRNPLNHEPL